MNARSSRQPALVRGLALSMLLAPAAMAASTDLANVPLWANLQSTVKPNILFTLDDSGSMADDVLPDDANFVMRSVYSSRTDTITYAQFGGLSSQCNGIAYNPSTTYQRRLDYKGDEIDAGKPTASDILSLLETTDASQLTTWPQWLKAIDTAAVAASGTLTVVVNSSSVGASTYSPNMPVTIYDWNRKRRYMVGIVKTWDSATLKLTVELKHARDIGAYGAPVVAIGTPTEQLYYTYNAKGALTPDWAPEMSYSYPTAAVDKTQPFYKQCASKILTGSVGFNYFTPQIMTPSNPQAANYWLWKKLYGTRMKAMQTMMSRAFRVLDTRHRVGFTTISNTGVADASDMLQVSDFNDKQKEAFYTALFAASPGGNTPLRGALQKAGRYFAKKMPGQSYDPMQYSCQKNFLILSTDGYWNTYDEMADYGPYTIDGKANVGNQDGLGTMRPMFEGGSKVDTFKYTWTSTKTWQRNTTGPISAKDVWAATGPAKKESYVFGTDSKVCATKPYTYLITKTSTGTGTYSLTRTYTSKTVYENVKQVTTYDRTDTLTTSGADVADPKNAIKGTANNLGTGAVTVVSTASPDTYVYSDATGAVTPTGTWTTPVASPAVCTTLKAAPADVISVNGAPTSTTGPTTSGSKSLGGGTTAVAVAGTESTTLSAETLVSKSSNITGATSDTLADLAMYYYKTDLRTTDLDNCTGSLDKDVCENNVPVKAGDKYDNATHQHLITYTIGLGNPGTLRYNPNYKSTTPSAPDDYFRIGDDFQGRLRNGRDWSNPSGGGATRIDDMWHAAVNGRGNYYSASNVRTLEEGLNSALLSIDADTGTSAAAATSTLQPVEGDDGIYISQFTSPYWTGDLRKYRFNADGTVTTKSVPSGGSEAVDNAVWSAAAKLTGTTARSIYFFRPTTGAQGTLVEFDASQMDGTTELPLFSKACDKPSADRLFQCRDADATTLAALNSGSTMVSYLRGQEKAGYRSRSIVLGDLVNSAPVFLGPPKFKYTENGYATWASNTLRTSRPRLLLVGGNDGMLHAFKDNDPTNPGDTTGGTEVWAYVPRLVMDKMYKLADTQYNSKHQFYVDGSPVVADIYDGSGVGTWRTIVVGGLNAGGRGFYALDVTNPASPVALWEFGPNNLPAGQEGRMGYSYGTPIVTKAKDGTWIVALTSGYNNPDGGGYVFIVNALTGQLIKTLSTGVGDSSNPSGLAKLNAWIESVEENRALRLYGGDLTGRLYRFDFDSRLGLSTDVVQLARFQAGSVDQSITTAPMLAEFMANGAKRRVVYVGTGRFLGTSDVSTTTVQSIYGIVDELKVDGLGAVRSADVLVQQPVDTTSTPRGVGSKETAVDWSKKKGWYADLPTERERVNVDPMLVANTLVVVGNVPSSSLSSDCQKPGDNQSWLYSFNIMTGNGNSVGLGSMVAGLGAIQTPIKADGSGGGDIVGVVTDTKGRVISPAITPLTSSGEPARRSTWRELR